MRDVYFRLRLDLQSGVPRVGDHADYVHRLVIFISLTQVRNDLMFYGIGALKVTAREDFVDDGHLGRAFSVTFVEVSAAEQWNAHRAEITGTYGAIEGHRRNAVARLGLPDNCDP